MNEHRDLHAAEALPIPTNEIVALRLVERDEVLPAAPIPRRAIKRAVIVSCLVHFKHIVLRFLVPERNEVADVKRLVVGPKSVVDAGVPALVGTDNVVRCRGGMEEEEEQSGGEAEDKGR